MDHKVSKDMISSGMIPSGEKTQADLSRTQYGTAPSPSKLMDAYKSMYDKKEEVINEHHQKDKDGNTIPHEGEELNELKSRTMLDYIDKASDSASKELDKAKKTTSRKKEVKARLKMDKRERGIEMAKDKIMKRVKTEEVDKFDIVFNHFISEGYSEKEAYTKMANLTEEQLDEFLKALAQAGMRGAQAIGKKTQGLAARAAQQGANLGQKKPMDVISPVKRKPFDTQPTPRKPFDAKKPEPKIGDDNFRAKTASDVVTSINMKRKKEREITPNKGQVMQDEYQYIDEIANLVPMIMKGAATVGKALKPVADAAKKVVKSDTVKNLATQTAVGAVVGGMGGGGQKQRTGTVSNTQYASADLFDIVKGQLLDEGLSEEEIKDIMLTLTPDEILKEMDTNYPAGKGANYQEKPNVPEKKKLG